MKSSTLVGLFFCLFFCISQVFAESKKSECKAGENLVGLQTDLRSGVCIGRFFDATKHLKVSEIVAEKSQLFKYDTSISNLGMKRGQYWLHLKLKKTSSELNNVFLGLNNPLARGFIVYRIQHNQSPLKIAVVDPAAEIDGSQVSSRDLMVNIPFDGLEEQELIIATNSVSQNFEAYLQAPKIHEARMRLELLLFGVYFGMIGVMILYNFWLFVAMRDKLYLYYTATITFLHGLLFSSLTGGTRLLLPENQLLATRHIPFSMTVGFVFSVLFSISFLDASKTHPRLTRLAKGLMFFVPIQFAMMFFELENLTILLVYLLNGIVFSLVIFIALKKALNKDKSARIFLGGWSLLVLGWYSFSLAQNGIVEHNFFTYSGFLYGSALEVVLFSIALGERVNSLTFEKECALRREAQHAQERARLDGELTAARAVQEALLPERSDLFFPYFEKSFFYRAAEQVGGDWYWCSQNKDTGEVYIYIGDVTGHGIPSALMTGVVCGSVNTLESKDLDFSEHNSIQSRLIKTAMVMNEVVCKTGLRSNRCVTMCIIHIDPRTGVLTYCNAGHPFPVVWHNKREAIDSCLSTGPFLGTPDGHWATRAIQLDVGDLVFLYTDGYQEAEQHQVGKKTVPRKRDLYQLFDRIDTMDGVNRKIADRISSALGTGTHLNDDLTYMLVRWIKQRTESSETT